jgi:hypothetical protein
MGKLRCGQRVCCRRLFLIPGTSPVKLGILDYDVWEGFFSDLMEVEIIQDDTRGMGRLT